MVQSPTNPKIMGIPNISKYFLKIFCVGATLKVFRLFAQSSPLIFGIKIGRFESYYQASVTRLAITTLKLKMLHLGFSAESGGSFFLYNK